MFEVNDKVEPLYDFLAIYIPVKEYIVLEVRNTDLIGTSGQWLKITEYNDWIDSSYFKK